MAPKKIPDWSPQDLAIMREMADKEAWRDVDRMYPDTPENSKVRKQEFLRRSHDEFRKLSDPNWPSP